MPTRKSDAPRIAFFDIETAPMIIAAWTPHEADAVWVERDTHLLSFAVSWAGSSRVKTYCLPDFPGYRKDPYNDEKLARSLWEIMDSADVIIAHNGDSFDLKKSNARFLVHGLKPPEPYKSVDTLKIARKNFKFDSNKLDNLARYLKIGRKLPHTGAHLWRSCLNGDKKSWALMRRYNAHDVELLRGVYEKLRAWDKSHPILTAITPQSQTSCPTCLSHNVQRRGWNIAKYKKTPRFQCQEVTCGRWFSIPMRSYGV